MEMDSCNPPLPAPLYEKIICKSKLYRAYLCLHFVLLLSFLRYRLWNPSVESYGLWILAFACELWFSFEWILDHNQRWLYVEYKTYPERLAQRYGGESASKLPAVDIIITTTDPGKEPAIMTANTVLSVLAIDYPVERIACYVSDDGASPVTFYSLLETLNFAKKWVPFCRKFNIHTRAPFMYFSKETKRPSDPDFLQQWQDMKDEYESMKRRITEVLDTGSVTLSSVSGIDGFVNRKSDIRNHPTIVQVIHENKEVQGENDVLPHLIYVAREKHPKVNHHDKAGAMNVMARVSGTLTNAPFILNVDCDTYVGDCKVIQHAMCFFLDCKSEKECGFVQFRQAFHGGLKDDPFGNQCKVFWKTVTKGMNAIQGIFYAGSCCFHRRKALYGVPPEINESQNKELPDFISSCSFEAWRRAFGESSVLVAAAENMVRDTSCNSCSSSPSLFIDEALKVASCSYETNTAWGKVMGWLYGSTSEDVMTGIKIHSLGWHSIYCNLEQPAFFGCTPGNGPDCLVQQQRWASGLLEILMSKQSPLLGIKRSIKPRQRLVYANSNLWAVWSVPVLCYTILPAFCLLHGKSFLPKVSESSFPIAVALFLSVYGFKLQEYLVCGCSFREWWNNERMWLIVCTSSWFLALFDVLLKIMGLSETIFVVTPKESEEEGKENKGDFTFVSSPLFIVPTTVLFINLAAIAWSILSILSGGYKSKDKPFAEYFCSIWVVMNLWPFVKGLFRKGKRGIPWIVIFKASALAVFLCSICV